MRSIAPDVCLVEGMRRANVYLLVCGGSCCLIDSGMPGEMDHIAAEMQRAACLNSSNERLGRSEMMRAVLSRRRWHATNGQ